MVQPGVPVPRKQSPSDTITLVPPCHTPSSRNTDSPSNFVYFWCPRGHIAASLSPGDGARAITSPSPRLAILPSPAIPIRYLTAFIFGAPQGRIAAFLFPGDGARAIPSPSPGLAILLPPAIPIRYLTAFIFGAPEGISRRLFFQVTEPERYHHPRPTLPYLRLPQYHFAI